jgi:hypothetical protein
LPNGVAIPNSWHGRDPARKRLVERDTARRQADPAIDPESRMLDGFCNARQDG